MTPAIAREGSEKAQQVAEKSTPGLDVVSGEVYDVDPTWQKKVTRKIDKRILICCMITYTFNFIDKILLGNSAIFGIIPDTRLVGQQFSWLSSIFYFGYLLWEYPTTILIQKVPMGKYLSGTVLAWGVVIATTAACTDFGGLATTRFRLGSFEATSVPAFVYLVSQWYTRDEIPSRTGIWFDGTDIGAATSSLIIYGLGHIRGGFSPWRAMFIIFGVLTFLWGIALWFLMPKAGELSSVEGDVEQDITDFEDTTMLYKL